MPCTTILVGKKASLDGSPLISRTDDGHYDVKKLVLIKPEEQPRKYKSVIGHLEIELPDNPLRYTSTPNVDLSDGLWPASGINGANVAMTATETITTNARVLAADPLVEYVKAENEGEEDIPGGIGEEDLVTIVLPYIHSAREGVTRVASLLEEYGTYESNGMAFSDENEIWWLESIGGHHWIAAKVPDDRVVVAPNQFAMDNFDIRDALGEQKNYMCSADLRQFIEDNRLNMNFAGDTTNPREIFGSRTDSDHCYNTPRAWFMGRYLCPTGYKWDGPNADFTPESDNIPFSFVPERKVSVEDVNYLLASHYQGTEFDPYSSRNYARKGIYRTIGIARTGDTSILQIRNNVPDEIKAVEWLCFGSTTFAAFMPFYTNVESIPEYLGSTTMDVSTDNYYWASRVIAALADSCFGKCVQHIERYHGAMAAKSRRIILEYDKKMTESGDFSLTGEANEKICDMASKETFKALNNVLKEASMNMKNNYYRSDN